MTHLPHAAVEVLIKGIETRRGGLSAAFLDTYYPDAAVSLQRCGFLVPDGDGTVIAFQDDHEDVPTRLTWSPEGGGYGYFSPTAGWVGAEPDDLAEFRIDVTAVIASLMSRISDRTAPPPASLLPDLLWDTGEVRLSDRTRRVPVWFARRLHVPAEWDRVREMMRARPTSDLRVLLTTTPAARLPTHSVHGHFIVPVLDVLAHSNGLVVDPAILAARVNNPFGAPGQIVKPSADFGVVSIRGKDFRFRGVKQRAIMRQLVPAWLAGQPKVLTAKVLLEAEYKDSVNTLAKAFAGHADWREFAAEQDGFCWLVV